MEYSFIFNGREYELPRYTQSVMEKIRKVTDKISNPSTDNHKHMYNLVVDLVGKESATEMFGSDNVKDMDLNDITIAYLRICKAYDKPVEDAKASQGILDHYNSEDRELIMEIIKNAGNVQTLTNSVGKQVLRQC